MEDKEQLEDLVAQETMEDLEAKERSEDLVAQEQLGDLEDLMGLSMEDLWEDLALDPMEPFHPMAKPAIGFENLL